MNAFIVDLEPLGRAPRLPKRSAPGSTSPASPDDHLGDTGSVVLLTADEIAPGG